MCAVILGMAAQSTWLFANRPSNRCAMRVEGQINPQGTIAGQYDGSVYTVAFVSREQSKIIATGSFETDFCDSEPTKPERRAAGLGVFRFCGHGDAAPVNSLSGGWAAGNMVKIARDLN